mmetsp:Transcript_10952/g.20222  ORF Transcript_10952/g.20222 Transcript_10952/m.20222 type:complete len:138 (-) Transcript_10952:3447-3860(-)
MTLLRYHILKGNLSPMYKELMKRIVEIDVLKHDTWSNVDNLNGKCALVTCMNFMSCLGYRAPTAWQDTLEISGKLLMNDGVLAMFDHVKHGNFGNKAVMEEFVKEKNLNFELVKMDYAPWTGGKFVCLVWKKVENKA